MFKRIVLPFNISTLSLVAHVPISYTSLFPPRINVNVKNYILSLVLILNVCWSIPMQSQKVISLKVAKDGMSRISVASQRIEHVFAHPSSVNSSLQLHESGNLYISPIGLVLDKVWKREVCIKVPI